MRPDVSEQFVNLLRIGQSVSAKGYGTENEFGRSVEVTEPGAPGQPLTAIYSPINSPATGAPHRLFHENDHSTHRWLIITLAIGMLWL